jgi:hypothetical protein
MKQNYTTKETAAQNFKNQLKSNTENEKPEELKREPIHGRIYWDLERPKVDRKNPWRGYVDQTYREKRGF